MDGECSCNGGWRGSNCEIPPDLTLPLSSPKAEVSTPVTTPEGLQPAPERPLLPVPKRRDIVEPKEAGSNPLVYLLVILGGAVVGGVAGGFLYRLSTRGANQGYEKLPGFGN